MHIECLLWTTYCEKAATEESFLSSIYLGTLGIQKHKDRSKSEKLATKEEKRRKILRSKDIKESIPSNKKRSYHLDFKLRCHYQKPITLSQLKNL